MSDYGLCNTSRAERFPLRLLINRTKWWMKYTKHQKKPITLSLKRHSLKSAASKLSYLDSYAVRIGVGTGGGGLGGR